MFNGNSILRNERFWPDAEAKAQKHDGVSRLKKRSQAAFVRQQMSTKAAMQIWLVEKEYHRVLDRLYQHPGRSSAKHECRRGSWSKPAVATLTSGTPRYGALIKVTC
jgi:hypothetical protein